MPRLLRGLEALNEEFGGVDYLLGIARNKALERSLQPSMAEAAETFARTRSRSRVFTELSYQAGSWGRERKVIGKAEHMSFGANPRFVITSIAGFEPALIYQVYCQRGQAENFIKDLKNGLKADRLSCHRFAANFFRLILHAVAYRLMLRLRQHGANISPQHGRYQFDTLRNRLLKVAVVVWESCPRLLIRLPDSFPLAALFRKLALQLQPP